MAEVQADNIVHAGYRGPDRRRGGFLGKLERATISIVRSRWIAMFAVAFSVSWGFHIVEERSDRNAQRVEQRANNKIEHSQRVVECTLEQVGQTRRRVDVGPILEACEEQPGK